MCPHNVPRSVSALALFRFSVVSEVRGRVARGQLRVQAVRQTAAHLHIGPRNEPRRVGIRSLYRWLSAFERQGIDGLHNKPRTCATDGVLEPALVVFLIDEKTDDPRASVPELLRRAVVAGLLKHTSEVDRTTAWRALKRRAIDTRRVPKVRDQRRFSYEHRNQMVLCDGKHFRAGPTRAKRVALFFIDDATRYIPVVVVGTSETTELFLRGLHRLLCLIGHIDGVYVDLGSGFNSLDVRAVIANLQFAHLLGTPAYPEARGKIERFNLTAQEDLLRHLAADDVDPDCAALELRIAHYLRTDYNQRSHEALKKGQTPNSRYLADPRPLTPYSDGEALRRHFFVDVQRRVTNDHIVSIDGRHWEVPRGLARQKITVRRDVFDPLHLLLDHDGKTLRLSEVDRVANAHDRRARPAPTAPERPPSGKGAALTAANAALSPITQPDGGFAALDEED